MLKLKQNVQKYSEERVNSILQSKWSLVPEPLKLLCEGKYTTPSLMGKKHLIRRVVAQVLDISANKEVLEMSFHSIEIMFSNKAFSEDWFSENRVANLIDLLDYATNLNKKSKAYALSFIFSFLRDPTINKISIDELLSSKEILNNPLSMQICSDSSFPASIELGLPLDQYHNDPQKRMAYLRKLSQSKVLSLLLSDPEFFYTSSNELLVKRFKEDLKSGKFVLDGEVIKDPILLFEKLGFFEEGIGHQKLRNLVSRLVSYDLLTGEKGVFSESQAEKLFDVFLSPLKNLNFDDRYVYLLGNLVQYINNQTFKKKLVPYLNEVYKHKNLSGFQKKAIEFFLSYFDSPLILESKRQMIKKLIKERSLFDPSLFVSKGKFTVINVFDTEDMDYHYSVSKKAFGKVGEVKQSLSQGGNELILIENKNTRIILIKGEPEITKTLLSRYLRQYNKAVVVFRGHSYKLLKHFPPKIFDENNAKKILFISGSCGSSSAIPVYIRFNISLFNFLANKRIGKGDVNLLLTKILIDYASSSKKPIDFSSLLKKHKKDIEKKGGDLSSISYGTLGEVAVYYAYWH